jgi:hypothetical protein
VIGKPLEVIKTDRTRRSETLIDESRSEEKLVEVELVFEVDEDLALKSNSTVALRLGGSDAVSPAKTRSRTLPTKTL